MTDTAAEKVFTALCSFCGKPNTQVAKLVAGPGVYICDECVALCQLIITESQPGSKPGSVPQLRAWELTDNVNAVLESLPRVARAADQVRAPDRPGRGRGDQWRPLRGRDGHAAAGLGQADRRGQAGHPGPDHQDIRLLACHAADRSPDRVVSLKLTL